MSYDIREHIKELLLTKKDLLTAMLTETVSTKFYGNEEDAELYITLMDKRQISVDTIIDIDNKLKEEPYISFLKKPSKDFEESLYLINNSIKVLAGKIIELDKKNAKDVEGIMSNIRKQLKGFKEKQSVNALYNNDTMQSNKNYLV